MGNRPTTRVGIGGYVSIWTLYRTALTVNSLLAPRVTFFFPVSVLAHPGMAGKRVVPCVEDVDVPRGLARVRVAKTTNGRGPRWSRIRGPRCDGPLLFSISEDGTILVSGPTAVRFADHPAPTMASSPSTPPPLHTGPNRRGGILYGHCC